MVLSLLGFVLMQVLGWQLARCGGAQRLRGALAAFDDIAGVSYAILVGTLGPPAQLRIATDADDVFDASPQIIADWFETSRRGGWHIAMAFAGDRCIGISQRNFQPVASPSGVEWW